MPDVTPAAPAATQTPETSPQTTAPNTAAAPAAELQKTPETRPDPMSPRFAALHRQSQQIAAAKQALARERAAQEAAIKAREAEISARLAKAEEFEKAREMALRDPRGYLKGIYGEEWYDLLTRAQLEGDKAIPADLQVRAVREELQKTTEQLRKEQDERFQALQQEREAARKAEQERVQAEYTQVVQDFETECVDFVKANQEKYELINSTDSHDLVNQVIRATFAKTKRVLSPAEAADLVEAHLEEQAAKVYAGKKWQARLAAAKTTEQPKTDEPARTLTNGVAAGAAVPGTGLPKDSAARHRAAVEAMEAAERAAQARAAK